MHDIPKRIVMDEAMQPVPVQIDIADWRRIERLLNLGSNGKRETDLAQPWAKSIGRSTASRISSRCGASGSERFKRGHAGHRA